MIELEEQKQEEVDLCQPNIDRKEEEEKECLSDGSHGELESGEIDELDQASLP